VGTVTIDGVNYLGDALFAATGETHIYIGGPYTDDGTIQLASPEGSIDFVGPARTPTGHTVAGGVIGRNGAETPAQFTKTVAHSDGEYPATSNLSGWTTSRRERGEVCLAFIGDQPDTSSWYPKGSRGTL
jgi:hypothetical protein